MEHLFKYHGLGNDFVLLDRRARGDDIDDALAQRLCDRRLGVGGDGVLVLLPSTKAFAKMVVHNADGSIPEMCGNGLRCAVKHLVERTEGRPAKLEVETGAGVLACAVAYGRSGEAEEITLSMGPALLVAPNLPSGKTQVPFVRQPVADGVFGTAVSMGNPHLVIFERPLTDAATLGPGLELHPGFPQRTNVELCAVRDGELDLVVWERGVGLTQACGTGACAAVAAAGTLGLLPFEAWVPVRLPGGSLQIKVAADLSEVLLRGPATFVFEGEFP